jgi:hypothetical protein
MLKSWTVFVARTAEVVNITGFSATLVFQPIPKSPLDLHGELAATFENESDSD